MIKVIQWCTGVAGQHVARAVINHPGMELVGCYVTGDTKHGRDVGEICGIDPIGVTATSDREEIYSMDADCVMYMALEEFGIEKPVDEICRLLSSGKNVVSTACTALIYPRAAGGDFLARLESACAQGSSTFHATGIQPGWAGDILPLVLSGVTGRIDHLLVQEVMDYATYPSPVSLCDLMGFGKEPQPVPSFDLQPDQAGAFGAPLLMIADALNAEVEKIVYECEIAEAAEDYDIAVGTIKRGMTAGKRYSFTAYIDGEPRMKIEHVTRAGAPVPDDWAVGQGWYVTIKGAPNWKLSAEIGIDGQDNNDAACLGASMHAVHAIEPVTNAEPGVKTLVDLPMMVGRGTLGKGVSATPGF